MPSARIPDAGNLIGGEGVRLNPDGDGSGRGDARSTRAAKDGLRGCASTACGNKLRQQGEAHKLQLKRVARVTFKTLGLCKEALGINLRHGVSL